MIERQALLNPLPNPSPNPSLNPHPYPRPNPSPAPSNPNYKKPVWKKPLTHSRILRAINQARKRSTNSRFWVQISSGGLGGLPREGVGAKKFGMSFETHGNQTFGHNMPGSLPGCPGGCPKSLRKNVCVQFWAPNHFPLQCWYRIRSPEEVISITETDPWQCCQRIPHCRYRFSLKFQFIPLQIQTSGSKRTNSVIAQRIFKGYFLLCVFFAQG